jgi:hypothetical protein
MREILSPLSGFGSPFGSRLLGGGFSPAILFAGGEVGVWYDPSPETTFTDTAGTTPATVGSAVALMLDKSKGLVLGPELVTNGDFSNGTTGWTAFTVAMTISEVSGEITSQSVGSNTAIGAAQTMSGLVVGRTYKVTGALRIAGGAETVELAVTNNARSAFVARGTPITSTTNVTTELVFVATETNNVLYLRSGRAAAALGWAGGFFDNISVRELPGNHATQSVTAARPILARVPARGRVNLTTTSEILSTTVAFDQGYFANINTGTRVGSSGVVNDDAETPEIPFYWRTTDTAYGLFGYIPVGALVSGQTYTIKMRIRSFGSNITGFVSDVLGSSIVSSSGFPVTAAEGWKDVAVVFVANDGRSIRPSGQNSNWGYVRFQIEEGSTASAYQKVTSTFDVTEAGQADNYYLFHGGSADPRWMQTPSIDFTGTDKMTVFAGVQLLVPRSNNSPMVQIGDSVISATDAVIIFRSGDGSVDATRVTFSGSGVNQSSRVSQAYPSTSVFSAVMDGAATGVSEIDYRIDGISVSSGSTTDSGITSIGSQVVSIGANNIGGNALNGQIYSLIVRGAQTDTPTIERTEKYVASKTAGIFNSTQVTWNSSTDTYTQSETTLGTR